MDEIVELLNAENLVYSAKHHAFMQQLTDNMSFLGEHIVFK